MARFSPDLLELLNAEREVDIEPAPDASGRTRRVTIWAVVDRDEAFVRSYRGAAAWWFRQVSAEPRATLHIAGRATAVRAVPATDPSSIERASRGFERKYAGDPSTPGMVAPEVLPTTLRVEPV